MSWTRVGWLFAVSLGFAVFSLSGAVIRSGGWPWHLARDFLLDAAHWLAIYLFDLAPILITLTIADNLPLGGTWRVVALVAALVIGAQFQWPLICTFLPNAQTACEAFPSSPWQSWSELLGDNTVWTIAYSAPIALTYFYRRRERQATAALHSAELARTDLERRRLEADLHTMQARVEPGFLFDTLGDLGDLYEREPALAERLLNGLIDYLRAALPDTEAARTTLRKEASLVRTFLSILALRSQGRLAAVVGVAPGLDAELVPPAMIVPLLAAIAGPAAAIGDGSSLEVAAVADGAALRIVVTGRNGTGDADEVSKVASSVRERLETLYGDGAALRVRAEPARRVLTAVLDLPRSHA